MSSLINHTTRIQEQSLLVQSLEKLGYTPQINAECRGYYGAGNRTVDVNVPQEQITGQSYKSDVGFKRNSLGYFDAVMDHLNRSDKDLLEKINSEYTVKAMMQAVGLEGYEYFENESFVGEDGQTVRQLVVDIPTVETGL